MHGASSRRVAVTLVDAAPAPSPSGGGASGGGASGGGVAGAVGAAGAEAEGLPFTYLSASKAGGVRQAVPTSAEDPLEPLDPASTNERPLKVRLVSFVSA